MSKSNLGKLEEHQLCGSKHCPGCGHKLEGKPDWLGLPAGVKFDPTDQELIEHLEAKVEANKDSKSHPLIDEFIPTIEGEDGICYTHPEKLPGVTRDGLSRHFFHRPSKAYTTGTRKRRKIQTECDFQGGGETRWHKTGKTRPVMASGKQKGCKKILVLYTNFGKNRKPEKTNWVMHQYHLGHHEEEKEGELVVSKIFYQTQPRQCSWSDRSSGAPVSSSTGGEREYSGSGSCSSAKEVICTDELRHRRRQCGDMSLSAEIVAPVSCYGGAVEIQQLKPGDVRFSFAPSTKNFDQVRIGDQASTATCMEEMRPGQHHVVAQLQQHGHDHQNTNSAFHDITRPSPPISTMVSSLPQLNHTSILLNHDPYLVSSFMLQNQTFQQQQHHQKLGSSGRSTSGLEELIMGCTSTDDTKEESSMANQREAEWLKYSSFWHDSDNQDHHE